MTTPAPAISGPVTPARIASVGRRIGAYVIDALIIGIVIGIVYAVFAIAIVGAAAAQDAGALVALTAALGFAIFALGVAWLIVLSLLQAGKGSVGQRLLSVVVVRRDSGQSLSFGAALGRNLIFGLAGSIIVGYFSPLFDSSGFRQGWHDKVVGGVMVDRAAVTASRPSSSAAAPPPPPFGHPTTPPPPSGSTPVAPPSSWPASAVPSAPPLPAAPPAPPAPPAASSAPVLPTGLVSAVPGISHAPTAATDTPPPPPVLTGITPSTAPSTAFSTVPAPPRAAEPGDAESAVPEPGDAEPAVPAPPTPPAAASEPPAPAADLDETRLHTPRRDKRTVVVTWDDGVEHVVTGGAVFGRNPEAPTGLIGIAVADATRSLSKTHFELVVEPDAVFLVDRNSTNGTSLTVADGSLAAATPGERTILGLGQAVVIGDRTFTVGELA